MGDLKIFDEEREFPAPVEEKRIKSIEPDDRLLDQ